MSINSDFTQQALGDAHQLATLNKRLDDLSTLGSQEKTAEMLDRLAAHMDEFVNSDDPDVWADGELHRMIGLAGMLGFAVVANRFRAVEEGARDPQSLRLARASAEAAVKFVRDRR